MKDNRKVFNWFASWGEKLVAFAQKWESLILVALLVIMVKASWWQNPILFWTIFVLIILFVFLCDKVFKKKVR